MKHRFGDSPKTIPVLAIATRTATVVGDRNEEATFQCTHMKGGDKSANGGNILTRSLLSQLRKFDGQKLIYCAGCLLGKDRLQAERIIVRQTPYEIKVS